MDPIEQLRIFVRIAQLGSFTRAADSLGLPKASASNAVRQLEQRLGSRLLERSTRRVELSSDGRVLVERASSLLSDYDELNGLFRSDGGALHGRLRVDMPVGMARQQLIPRLGEFLRRHPGIELELSCTDRRVDLIEEGFDCVLRVGFRPDDHLIARKLGALPIINCASPDYLARHGVPQQLTDLDRHWLIRYSADFGRRGDGFEYRDTQGDYLLRPMPVALSVNSSEAYQAACLAGLGIIQAPRSGLHAQLADGALVEILRHYPAEPMPVYLLYAHRRSLSLRLRAFVEFVQQVLASELIAAP